MAKKILPFPLEMKNGAKVRSIDELRANADMGSIVSFYLDGKLNRWCKAFYYDNITKNVANVTEQTIRKLYEILGININQSELDAYLNEKTAMKAEFIGTGSVEMGAINCNNIKEAIKEYIDDKINLSNFDIKVSLIESESEPCEQYKIIIEEKNTQLYLCLLLPCNNISCNIEDIEQLPQNVYKEIAITVKKLNGIISNIEETGYLSSDKDDGFILVTGNDKLSDFYICDHPVTQKEYFDVVGKNPSNFETIPLPFCCTQKELIERMEHPEKFKCYDNPVENVSWYDAVAYCNKLSEKEGLTPCYSGNGKDIKCNYSADGYRLPRKIEWLFAAMGGNRWKNCAYNDVKNIDDVAWYKDNSDNQTHPVKQKKPNELGIYDMFGNVWEWGDEVLIYGGSYQDKACELPDMMEGKRTLPLPPFNSKWFFEYQELNEYNAQTGFRVVRNASNLYMKIINCIEKIDEVDKRIQFTNLKQKLMNSKQKYLLTDPNDFVLINGNGQITNFYIYDHPVTQYEYNEIMGNNPSCFKGDNNPVETVSWYDAVEYCNRLSEIEGLTPCYSGEGSNIICDFKADGYRLPTEEEWVFAASGGNESNGHKYSGSDDIDEVAWYNRNSDHKTHPVKKKKPNELGIYDMSGNVWEWCWDHEFDPDDMYTYSFCVLCGGSYSSIDDGDNFHMKNDNCEVSDRMNERPGSSERDFGFRVVRSAKK